MNELTNVNGFWRYREAARFLSITEGVLRKKVSHREVPFAKPFGPRGRVLFDPERLREFVLETAVEPDVLAPPRRGPRGKPVSVQA